MNLKYGPALIIMNRWPRSSIVTMSQSPEGVSWILDVCRIRDEPSGAKAAV